MNYANSDYMLSLNSNGLGTFLTHTNIHVSPFVKWM